MCEFQVRKHVQGERSRLDGLASNLSSSDTNSDMIMYLQENFTIEFSQRPGFDRATYKLNSESDVDDDA